MSARPREREREVFSSRIVSFNHARKIRTFHSEKEMEGNGATLKDHCGDASGGEVNAAIALLQTIAECGWQTRRPDLKPLQSAAIRLMPQILALSEEEDDPFEEAPPPNELDGTNIVPSPPESCPDEIPPSWSKEDTLDTLSYHELLAAANAALRDDAQLERAQTLLSEALRLVPDSARARRLRASLHERRGDIRSAHRDLAEAQSIDYSPDLHERLEDLKRRCASSPPTPTSTPTPSPAPPTAPDVPISHNALNDLMGMPAMQSMLQNPSIMQMAQKLATDPSMRSMVENMVQK